MTKQEQASLKFTVTRCQEGSANGGEEKKTFTVKLGAEKPIRIGRATQNEIVVSSRGVSQYHAELRLVKLEGNSVPQLCVRDLSTNGTGLKRPVDKAHPIHLEKQVDMNVPSGAVVLVPMMLKVSQDASDRAWLKVEYEGSIIQGAEVSSDDAEAAKEKEGSEEDAKGDEVEANRMRFVELLLKTREVSSGTTYEQAKKLLSDSKDWDAVDESTRKECFDIFVQHLSTHGGEKKKKEKKNKEGKQEKSKARKDPDGASVATPEPKVAEPKKRRKSSPERNGSVDKKRKRSRRSRSRQARSGSGERGSKRRRRSSP